MRKDAAMNDLVSRFSAVRSHTAALAAPLSAEDCGAQSMPDASPVKWHLAHTTWFFETFVLEPNEPGLRPFHPAFRVLFNSYYNGVGARHLRPQRGLLTRPALSDVLAYRANVEQRMQAVLARQADNATLQSLVELGLQHEQQHQELLLTDVLHLLSCNPGPWPTAMRRRLSLRRHRRRTGWSFPGLCEIGHGRPVSLLTTNCHATPPTLHPTHCAADW